MTLDMYLQMAVTVALATPGLLVVLLGASALLSSRWREATIARLTRSAMLLTFVAILGALVLHIGGGLPPRTISYGAWFAAGTESSFAFDFNVDGLSLGFAALSAAVCGIVAAFSQRYLHRESGFLRYFFLFSLFVNGIMLVALAGSIEVLFAGWEFLGISSALLVAFFHERQAPVQNALRVFAVYRVSDAALLTAAVLLHHEAGSGSLSLLFSREAQGAVGGASPVTALIALLLVAAVAGKSALFPLSGWLPRAMEGPTPSSAVYYGALSIHAGCFLLLRAAPLLEQSMLARVLTVICGVTTALYATLAARAQSDVKSGLAFAAMTQVGLIVAEIALGLYIIAFVHIVGHTCFRLLQFLSAPNVMHDLRMLEDDLGGPTQTVARAREHRESSAAGKALYLFALERGFLDTLLDRAIIIPFQTLSTRLDAFDRFLCAFGKLERGAAHPEKEPQDD